MGHSQKLNLSAIPGLTHKTKETWFLAGDSADEIKISRLETRFLRKSYILYLTIIWLLGRSHFLI